MPVSILPAGPIRAAQNSQVQAQLLGSIDLPASALLLDFIQRGAGTGTFAGWQMETQDFGLPAEAYAEINFVMPVAAEGKMQGIGLTNNLNFGQTVSWRVNGAGGVRIGEFYAGDALIASIALPPNAQPNNFDYWKIKITNGQFLVYQFTRINPSYYDYVLQGGINLPLVCAWQILGLRGNSSFDNNINSITRAPFSRANLNPGCWQVSANPNLTVAGGGDRYTLTMPSADGVYDFSAIYPGAGAASLSIVVGAITFSAAECGSQQPAGSRITLNHNGGQTAQIQVSGGVVIPQTSIWILPNNPGIYTAELYLNGVTTGAICTIHVVPLLSIENVNDGFLDGIAPGTAQQLIANLPNTVFSSPTHPTAVLPSGMFFAAGDENNNFGKADYVVTARNGTQIYEFTIEILPQFPRFPAPRKTQPNVPEFPLIKDNGERGCPDRRTLNLSPVRRWDLAYEGLLLRREDNPPLDSDCADDETAGDNSSETLDLFWLLVRGGAEPFWFADEDGALWENTYFEQMTRTHEDWESQDRAVRLIWEGCCETETDLPPVVPHPPPDVILPPAAPTGLRATVFGIAPPPSPTGLRGMILGIAPPPAPTGLRGAVLNVAPPPARSMSLGGNNLTLFGNNLTI